MRSISKKIVHRQDACIFSVAGAGAGVVWNYGTQFAHKKDGIMMNSDFIRCAVPVFGQDVAPRYDVAVMFRLFEVNRKKIVSLDKTLNTSGLDGEARLAMLIGAGTEVLLCGGIRRFDLFRLHAEGIRVVPGLRGPVEAVVSAFANGQVVPWMPGRRRGRGHGGRGRRNWNR